MQALIQNAGQSCSAGTRLLVERTAYDEVIERVTTALSKVKIGPGIEDPDIGPLIAERQLERATSMLAKARDQGATIVIGGGHTKACS